MSQTRIGWACLGVAVVIGAAVVIANLCLGHPIEQFRLEYAGGGSCKLRGRPAFELLLLVGVLSLPCAICAASLFLFGSVRANPSPRALIGLVVSSAVLWWLVDLGFIGPALGLCPR